MPYNAFNIDRVRRAFGLTIETPSGLFEAVRPVPLDPLAATMIDRYRGLAGIMGTDKAKAELVIAPLLSEFWRAGRNRVSLLSGVALDVDPAADLAGVCDFVLGYSPQLNYVMKPVAIIAQAKDDNLMPALGPCAAAMVAAQGFNALRNQEITVVYGAVCNGACWKFLRLSGATLEVDLDIYAITEPDRILGIILHFVGLAPLSAPAAA